MLAFSQMRSVAWNTTAEMLGLTLSDVLTGASSAKFLRGDGTWAGVTATALTVSTTDRLIGRDSAGSGASEELTVSGGIEFTGSLGIQTSAFTGDVTKTAGGTALTLASVVAASTNTKITYNAKGLVTAGSQAAASDLSNGTTGSGAIVLATSATLVTPALGTPTALVGTNITGTAAGLSVGGTAAGLSVVLVPASGGTGVANNNASTLTISGNFATTLTVSGTTGVTLPTSGTLATLAGSEEFTNKTLSASVGKGTWTASGTWTLPALTLGGAITYGGVTLSNAVTGTGNMVLSANQTLTGTLTGAIANFTTLTASLSISANSGSTSSVYLQAVNIGGQTIFATENSTGGGLVTGTTAYSGISGTLANSNYYFVTNNTVRGLFGNSGGFQIGAPTGGDKGAGTTNLAGALYANNTQVISSSGAGSFTTGSFTSSITKLGNITTSGVVGSPAIVATGRSVAATAAVTSVSAFTVGGSDASFEVSCNVNVTTATTHNFTATCAYTDETNTARTLTFGFVQLTGSTFITAITNLTGAGPYESPLFHIRCKASTTITIATTGTFTLIVYNVEGLIKQIA